MEETIIEIDGTLEKIRSPVGETFIFTVGDFMFVYTMKIVDGRGYTNMRVTNCGREEDALPPNVALKIRLIDTLPAK